MKDRLIDYIDIIKQNNLFSDLTDELVFARLEKMNAHFTSYKKNDILHISGEPLKKFGIVVYGTVNVLTDDAEGNRAIMAEVTKGKTFGESLSFLKIENPDIYISAVTDTGIVWLSSDNLFIDLSKKDIQIRFTQMMAKRTLLMNERIQILSKITLREKILTYLSYLSKHNGDKTKVTVPFNREDMATYIGANRTALSRELSKLKNEGIIYYKKNEFLLNFKK